jgi:CheY-like chemotaxis protein
VIDDEEFILSAYDALFRILDLDVDQNVDFTMSGKEAIQYVKKMYSQGIIYKLILTDISMPVLDGI